MEYMIHEIPLRTSKRCEMINIDHLIKPLVKDIKEGIVTIFVKHTTAGVTINENADPDVRHDLLKKLEKLAPHGDGYMHMEGNSDSHIKVLLTGSSVQVMIKEGKMLLGTWQSVFFCEYDGPRERKFLVRAS